MGIGMRSRPRARVISCICPFVIFRNSAACSTVNNSDWAETAGNFTPVLMKCTRSLTPDSMTSSFAKRPRLLVYVAIPFVYA
jgi:hypothetical protein